MSDLTVATTIRQQLGNACLALLGAKNLVGGDDFLMFNIGKGPKKINKIKITLDPSDTYTLEFFWIWGVNVKTVKKVSGVYADMLHDIIEETTGLYTSFHARR